MKNQLKKTVKGVNITKKTYNIIYTIPNLHCTNKAHNPSLYKFNNSTTSADP